MTSQQTVAVTCATGHQGRAVTFALAKAGYQVRALTRSPDSAPAKTLFDGISNVKFCKADYNDIASIKKAFEGVDIVFANTLANQEQLLAPPGSNFKLNDLTELEQGKRYADAAKAQRVKLFVLSTHHDGKKISGGKFDIDVLQDRIRIRDYVQQIGLPALFVQCGMYFELVYMFDLAKVNSDGTITFNSCRADPQDKVFPKTYVEADFGRAVALLVQNYSPAQKYETVRLFERNYCFQETMDTIAKVTGKKVINKRDDFFKVKDCDFDKMVAFYTAGYPEMRFTEMDPALKALGFQFTPLETFVKEKLAPMLV